MFVRYCVHKSVLQHTEVLIFSPTFLSCGRPYPQGNPPDGPSERSGPAIQKPNRAGNTHFGFCCSNSSDFILYFLLTKKVT